MLARRCRRRRAGAGAQWALAVGEMTATVGASHRLPSAARLGVARRNSLRSLCELRSDTRRESDVRSALRAPTPRLRCSAPPTSPQRPAPTGHPPRPAAACRSGGVTGVWNAGGGVGPKHHDAASKGAGRPSPACLCAAEKRSSAGPRAQRASLSDSPRLSERSSRSERSEFRGGAGAASIAGHPREAGASTGAPAAGGPRLCPRKPLARPAPQVAQRTTEQPV